MQCRLTRLSSTNRNLRTNTVEGMCPFPPTKGRPFFLTGKPLDPAAHVRIIETSAVQEVTPSDCGRVVEFKTGNSTYRWENLLEEPMAC